jgi:hypothetical protein
VFFQNSVGTEYARFDSTGVFQLANPSSFAAGTAALPSITATGDTNTGLYFPAADTIGFSEGGAEVARFDSSGNFGLGVTPSAWSWRALQVGSFGGFFATNSAAYASYLGNNAYYNAGWKYIASTAAVHYEMAGGDGAHRWYNAPSGTAGNAITFTQAMTLDANNNLLLGTTSSAGVNKGMKIIGGTSTSSSDYTFYSEFSNTTQSFGLRNDGNVVTTGNLLVGKTALNLAVGTSIDANT